MEFLTKNIGWIITILGLLTSWFVYVIRQNDKLNSVKDRQDKFEITVGELKETMSRLSNTQENQQSSIEKLAASDEKNTDILNELRTEIRVIAAWVKMQSGDTIIEHRSRKDK